MPKEAESFVEVRVQAYLGTRIRSYFVSGCKLCTQDGFVFRKGKTLKEEFGVITLNEAMLNSGQEVSKKVGEVGREIVRHIAISPLGNKLVEGSIVSASQLNVHFVSSVREVTMDKFIARIIGEALDRPTRIVVEKAGRVAA